MRSRITMSRSLSLHRPRRLRKSDSPWSFLLAKILLATLICALPRLVSAADHAPDWMHEAARQTLPAYPPETVAVVLLDECITTVKDKGEIETLYRRAYKILRPEARDEYGALTVDFDNERKLSYLKAWAIPASGAEYEVNDKEA